jgi:hypothetical protein
VKRFLVLPVLLLAACSGSTETKAEKWCGELMSADVDMTGLRQIYTDAVNDGAGVAELRGECGNIVQLVLDNGGTTSG